MLNFSPGDDVTQASLPASCATHGHRSPGDFFGGLPFYPESHQQCGHLRGRPSPAITTPNASADSRADSDSPADSFLTASVKALTVTNHPHEPLGQLRLARYKRNHEAKQPHALDIFFYKEPVLCAVGEVHHPEQLFVQNEWEADK